MDSIADKIVVDATLCSGCMRCAEVCLTGNFVKTQGKARVREDALSCFACGHCVAACPTGAIGHADLDTSAFQRVEDGERLTYEQLLAFLRTRRSRREFQDKPVPKELVEKLIQAAVQAPSALNRQSIRYTVVSDRSAISMLSNRCAAFLRSTIRMMENPLRRIMFRLILREKYPDLVEMLPEMKSVCRRQDAGEDAILHGAPLVMMLHAHRSEMTAAESSGYNAANVLLAAETLGLGACVVGFVTTAAGRDGGIKRLAQVPVDHVVHSTIALGFPKFRYQRSVPKREAEIRYVGDN